MRAFHRFWSDVRSSLWFVPAAMVAGSIALAVLLIELSDLVGADALQEQWPRLFGDSLIILRTIRGGDDPVVHPLAVFGGMVLAIAGIGFLIFFIHHIATSLEASSIIEAVTVETRAAIERLFPDELGRGVSEVPPATHQAARWAVIPASGSGYLQKVDSEGLLTFAKKRNVVVRMERGVGESLWRGHRSCHWLVRTRTPTRQGS